MGRKRRTDKHLPERMYLRSGTYYFAEYGTNHWVNLGRDYVRAMAEYALLRGPQGNCQTVADLIDRYLQEVAPAKAETSYRSNLIEARYLRAAFGNLRPIDIKPRAIYAYFDERGRTSPSRANREIALFSHMFTKAIRWGLVDSNPCTGVERFKLKPRRRYIEDWEYLAFKQSAGPFIAAYMDFKLLTGLRQSDILSMRLDQLKDDGIHVTISKTGRRNVIQWSSSLRAAVDQINGLRRRVTGLHLFCTRRGTPYSRDGFKSIWQRKMVSSIEKGVIQERFTEHDLRKKTASDTNLEHAQELLGHADARVTKRIYRVKPEVIRPLH